MKVAPLLPLLLPIVGCSASTTDPSAQATSTGVALPTAGAADAVRTAKPGTAPISGVTPVGQPTPSASATP